MKPKKYKHFGWGSKRRNALHTQLRVGRSFLNAHGFAINLVDSDLCLCSRPESVSHFLNGCFLYTEERRLLYSSMEQLVPKFGNLSDKMKTEILLHGINIDSEEFDTRNSKIIYLVQDYIFKTKRFWFIFSPSQPFHPPLSLTFAAVVYFSTNLTIYIDQIHLLFTCIRHFLYLKRVRTPV